MLKKLLQLLLNTRATKAQAGRSSLPAWSSTPILYTGNDVDEDWGSVFSQTMPSDGYLVVLFTGSQATSYVASHSAQCPVTWASGTGKIRIPLAQGEVVNVGGRHVQDVTIEFFPLYATRL